MYSEPINLAKWATTQMMHKLLSVSQVGKYKNSPKNLIILYTITWNKNQALTNGCTLIFIAPYTGLYMYMYSQIRASRRHDTWHHHLRPPLFFPSFSQPLPTSALQTVPSQLLQTDTPKTNDVIHVHVHCIFNILLYDLTSCWDKNIDKVCILHEGLRSKLLAAIYIYIYQQSVHL